MGPRGRYLKVACAWSRGSERAGRTRDALSPERARGVGGRGGGIRLEVPSGGRPRRLVQFHCTGEDLWKNRKLKHTEPHTAPSTTRSPAPRVPFSVAGPVFPAGRGGAAGGVRSQGTKLSDEPPRPVPGQPLSLRGRALQLARPRARAAPSLTSGRGGGHPAGLVLGPICGVNDHGSRSRSAAGTHTAVVTRSAPRTQPHPP
jgi:hypothetical protein